MDSQNFYMSKLPFELSGAISKNRFRNEILWGMEKIFDLYKSGNNFSVVFDYVCDVEIHLDGLYEFYQIKTTKNNTNFTINKIIKPKNGSSILGKLYELKQIKDERTGIKVAIVSNVALKDEDGKIFSDRSELLLKDLCEKSRIKINNSLCNELSLKKDIDINDMKFIYTTMDLFNPQDSLQGKTVTFFFDVTGKEPKKPLSLFKFLSDTISQKASYELICSSYDDLIKNKGITNSEINNLLNMYTDKIDEAVSKSIKYIESTYSSYKKNIEMKSALSKIVENLMKSKFLQNKEKEIVNYIKDNIDEFDLPLEDIIEVILKKFRPTFNIEYSEIEVRVFILLTLKKYEEDVYE